VQSRLREIDRLQPQDSKKTNIQRPYIRFGTTEKAPGKIVLKADDISKSYDGKQVINNFSLEIARGDRIGIIGNNGRGKTTLLKLLAQVLESDSGHVELGHQAVISYFPQNHSEIVDKQKESKAFDWLKERRPGVYDQEVRGVMGKLLFGGDDAFKPVPALSGGETARLILAGMMLSEHNLMILDEPNNHLDLEAVSALAWSLVDYKGTVIFASHDRSLIDNVATKIIAFEEDGIHIHDGTLEDYLIKKGK
jgi:ATPase subunit of ABC transporter with duplicated ATPase domains